MQKEFEALVFHLPLLLVEVDPNSGPWQSSERPARTIVSCAWHFISHVSMYFFLPVSDFLPEPLLSPTLLKEFNKFLGPGLASSEYQATVGTLAVVRFHWWFYDNNCEYSRVKDTLPDKLTFCNLLCDGVRYAYLPLWLFLETSKLCSALYDCVTHACVPLTVGVPEQYVNSGIMQILNRFTKKPPKHMS